MKFTVYCIYNVSPTFDLCEQFSTFFVVIICNFSSDNDEIHRNNINNIIIILFKYIFMFFLS